MFILCMQVLHSGPVCRSHVNPLCLGLEELYICVYRTCSLSCIQVSLSRLQEDLYAGLKELCTGSVKALPLHGACIAHRILSPLLEATAKADEVLQRIFIDCDVVFAGADTLSAQHRSFSLLLQPNQGGHPKARRGGTRA